jgi:hypothetical protein
MKRTYTMQIVVISRKLPAHLEIIRRNVCIRFVNKDLDGTAGSLIKPQECRV